jgi:hypothetical protein
MTSKALYLEDGISDSRERGSKFGIKTVGEKMKKRG